MLVAVAAADALTLAAAQGVLRRARRRPHRLAAEAAPGDADAARTTPAAAAGSCSATACPQELHPEPAQFTLRVAAAQPRRCCTTCCVRAAAGPSPSSGSTSASAAAWASGSACWIARPPRPIHVYPDMKQLGQYALLARTNRLSLLGVRRTRRIGQDNEFERLRDYTIDDNYKHIDWRATARRSKLTVQDYQIQPEPAAHLPHRLRADDDQRGRRPEPPGPRPERHAHAQLRGPAAGRLGGAGRASPTRSTATSRPAAA